MDPENFLGGGGGRGGGGVQIPRRDLTENFNMAKINNLAIPGGGGGGLDPLSPPLDPLVEINKVCERVLHFYLKNIL